MSDIMLEGVLRMPYEMAMESEIGRYQYWQRAQQALDEIESLRQQLAECREEREWLLDDVAKFRGERNALREELASNTWQKRYMELLQSVANGSALQPPPPIFIKLDDPTALDTMLKAAKREALLEAIESFDEFRVRDTLRNMAKELEG